MRRLALALFCLTLALPALAAARTREGPHERLSPVVKILKKLVRMLGDELIEPKP